MNNQILIDKLGESGLIIFDGTCGACSAFALRLHSIFEKYGFRFAPLQEEWVTKLCKLDQSILLEAMHIYTNDGKLYKGIDGFQYISSKVWWLKPLSIMFKVNILKSIFENIYSAIAKRRKKFSTLCGLQKHAIYK